MKLSEAIRLGAMLRPQGTHHYLGNGESCAMGAALARLRYPLTLPHDTARGWRIAITPAASVAQSAKRRARADNSSTDASSGPTLPLNAQPGSCTCNNHRAPSSKQAVKYGSMTVLKHAMTRGHHEIVKLLIQDERVDLTEAIEICIACGKCGILKCFLQDERVNPAAVDNNGWTALVFTHNYCRLKISKLLFLNLRRPSLRAATFPATAPYGSQ